MIRELFPDRVVTVELAEPQEGVLHPEEEACLRDAGEKRRRDFTLGRLAARAALDELGVEGHALLPDADRVPRWPEGIVGSLSHSGGRCAVAVARAGEVASLGVDLEQAGPLGARLVERICSPLELERFGGLSALEGADWPKLAFSAKEAAYKAYYPLARRKLGFHDLELEIDADARSFVARLVRDEAPSAAGRRVFAGRFAVGAQHVAAGVTLE